MVLLIMNEHLQQITLTIFHDSSELGVGGILLKVSSPYSKFLSSSSLKHA